MGNLGVYIQVPFCQTKCTYCNFHTGIVSPGRFAPYADAVCREIVNHRQLLESAGVKISPSIALQTQSVNTVYIGGGTPSLLEPELLTAMLQALRTNFDCSFTELTLEADPETIDAEKGSKWAAAGFNRISFGTQSFIDEELKTAGRMHRREDIYRAVPILRAAGIHNISFDLIAGLPKQTHASWRQSLSEAIALNPEHISIYMMEIDEGSRLGLEVLQSGSRYSAKDLPSEESMTDFYELAQAELKSAGYLQYEISNWAKPGFESRHNLKYWQREPYLGFGAGAHSFSGSQRWANRHDAAAYVGAISEGKSATESVNAVTPVLALEEEFFLGLRQLSGIDLGRIEHQYGVGLAEKVGELASRGIVEKQGNILRLPADKLSVSNEVIVELLRSVQMAEHDSVVAADALENVS
ncbi:MAG TPA: radical SAM family heme chaperone HemW [Candidatus Acidoferrum sp.]|jgi:oxygen-independent coproporphyrinogen-3 oxidase|nr:radical SAM family heme chaperone HemW [Candidatus Acidoferrum sp.]